MIAEGSRISSVARLKALKEDTILAWVRQAGDHVEIITEILLRELQIAQAQIDALWAFVAATRFEKRGLTADPLGVP